MYCFDVHCNAFFPFFGITYALQYTLLPVLLQPGGVIATILANVMYLLAFSLYFYHTFLGYDGLFEGVVMVLCCDSF